MPITSDLAFASIRTLGRKLRAGEFTSVGLTEFFLERLERLGPKFNAVVTVTRSLALGQAQRADRELEQGIDRGPLHGIPYGAKDLLATAGIPTSWGAAPLKDRVFDQDATAIVRLREAGAVLTAKLAMVEIAGGMGYRQANASFTGPGLNSWDPTAWSGGSSSGSGAAVGAGLVPFAIGSETWGSIMTPAGYCGVAGLRPTYGRVSRHGAMALSWTMDKLGPLARTADDCGLVLEAMAGHDPADATSIKQPYVYSSDEEGLETPLRLALLKDAATNVQPEVRANFERSLAVLAEFAEFEEIELPELPYTSIAGTFISCEMAAAFEGLVTSGDIWELTAPEDRVGAQAALLIPAKDYINAMRIRPFVQRALDEILARYDAVVTPTLASVAPPIAMSFREYHQGHRSQALSDLGGGGNASGIPALSVPNGFGQRGLPTGLQFVGRAFEENKLLSIARRYQAKTDWHEKYPEGE